MTVLSAVIMHSGSVHTGKYGVKLMTYSELIMEALDKTLVDEQSDFELDPDTPDDRPFTEVVIQFLESLGIEEGIDFVVENDDIYPASSFDVDPDIKPFKNLSFEKWPKVSFSYDGEEDVSVSSAGEKFTMPIGIFFLVQHHAYL
jgi:hypothetical protein